MSFRTPYSRVTGLGSAKEGTGHFWTQRMTAVANVPLMLFLVWLIVSLIGADRAQMLATFANPFVTAFDHSYGFERLHSYEARLASGD